MLGRSVLSSHIENCEKPSANRSIFFDSRRSWRLFDPGFCDRGRVGAEALRQALRMMMAVSGREATLGGERGQFHECEV